MLDGHRPSPSVQDRVGRCWGFVPLGMLASASAGQTPEELLLKLVEDSDDESDEDGHEDYGQTQLVQGIKEGSIAALGRQHGAKSFGS